MAARTEIETIRKAQIMRATRDVICEKGFDKTTMRDIGHRAGMSAAIVCYYFDDKKRLMKETLADACSVHRNAIEGIIDQKDLSPATKLDRVIEDTLPRDDDMRREWRFWLDYWAEAARDDELRVFIAESNVRFRGHLERIITEGVQAGAFRKDASTRELATDVAAMLDGYSAAMIMDSAVDMAAAKAAIHRHLKPC